MNRPGPGPQRPPPNLSSQPMATQYRGGLFQQQQQYALPQQQRAGAGVLGQFPPLTAAQAAAAAHRGPAGQPQAREFDPNEFPALGAPNQQSQTPGEQPGALNGFGAQDSRQSVLGALQGGQQPGLVNLGQQRLQQQFASDADKRNYGLPSSKAGNAAVAAAWNAPAVPPGLHQNGVGAHHNLSGPPGISIPYPGHAQQQQQQQQHVQQQPIQPTSSVAVQQPLSSAARDGPVGLHSFANAVSEARASPQQQTGTIQSGATQGGLPQTPAQQILVSPADRWGLMGLLALIKATDPDVNLLSYGQDLGTMGMDMNAQGHISSSFITPWSDSSAAHTVEPDFHLPSCYNVHTSPPNAAKAAAFSDETLFFMFYASPRDSLQEIAAQELYSRLWRFHKEQRVWITKDQQSPPSTKIQGGEIGVYLLFDPDNWERKRQEMTVLYADLEERPTPQFNQQQQQQAPPQQQHNNQAVFAQQQTPAPVQQGFAQQQTQGLQHLGMGGQQRFHGLGMTQVAGM